jgi:hypothetical protein
MPRQKGHFTRHHAQLRPSSRSIGSARKFAMLGQSRNDLRCGAPKIEVDHGTGSIIEGKHGAMRLGVARFDRQRHVDKRPARDAPSAGEGSTGCG